MTARDAERDAEVDLIARAICRAHAAACVGREPTHDLDVMMADFAERPEVEGWRAAARAAYDLGARSRRKDRRAQLQELLGVDSTNFLGTGMTLRELMQLHDAEKLSQSWALQPREEKKRRLAAVIQLSAELERIRQTVSFATRLAEMAIEAVIEGDWKMVEEWAEHFAFEDEREELHARSAAVYATFRELLLQVLRIGKDGMA